MGLLTGHFERVVNPLAPLAALLLAVLSVRVVWLVAYEGDVRAVGQGRFGRALTRALFVVAVLEIALWLARVFGLFGGPVAISG